MADLFSPGDVTKVLKNKRCVFLGASIVRGLYKDLLWLINSKSLIPFEVLGSKGEKHFPDLENTDWKAGAISQNIKDEFPETNRDCLGDNFKGLHSGRGYEEERSYYNKEYNISLEFKFTTRVWSKEISTWLLDHEASRIDVLIMNSGLWDVNRWGPTGPQYFKRNCTILMKLLSRVLSKNCQFLWLTTPPVGKELNSKGMNIPGLEFQCFTSRYHVIESNFHAADAVTKAGFKVVDLHFYMLAQAARRNRDGIHWNSSANRLMTNIVLTHLVLATTGPGGLPCTVKNNYTLEQLKLKISHQDKHINDLKTNIELLDMLSKQIMPKNSKTRTPKTPSQQVKEKLIRLRTKNQSRKEEYKEKYLKGGEMCCKPTYGRFHPYDNPQMRRWNGFQNEHTEDCSTSDQINSNETYIGENCCQQPTEANPTFNQIVGPSFMEQNHAACHIQDNMFNQVMIPQCFPDQQNYDNGGGLSSQMYSTVESNLQNLPNGCSQQYLGAAKSECLGQQSYSQVNQFNFYAQHSPGPIRNRGSKLKKQRRLKKLSIESQQETQKKYHDNLEINRLEEEDHTHPLWESHKQIFMEMLDEEREPRDLAMFVADQWRGQQVDPAQNLSSQGGQRKIRGMENKISMQDGEEMSWKILLDLIQNFAEKEGWSQDTTAEVIFGIEDASDLLDCYNTILSKDVVRDMISVEQVHNMITKMYDSPYKEDDQDDSYIGTWMKELLEEY